MGSPPHPSRREAQAKSDLLAQSLQQALTSFIKELDHGGKKAVRQVKAKAEDFLEENLDSCVHSRIHEVAQLEKSQECVADGLTNGLALAEIKASIHDLPDEKEALVQSLQEIKRRLGKLERWRGKGRDQSLASLVESVLVEDVEEEHLLVEELFESNPALARVLGDRINRVLELALEKEKIGLACVLFEWEGKASFAALEKLYNTGNYDGLLRFLRTALGSEDRPNSKDICSFLGDVCSFLEAYPSILKMIDLNGQSVLGACYSVPLDSDLAAGLVKYEAKLTREDFEGLGFSQVYRLMCLGMKSNRKENLPEITACLNDNPQVREFVQQKALGQKNFALMKEII